MKQNRSYMLDTNIFGKLRQEGLDPKVFYGACLFVTHNQMDEIQQTQDADKRNQLMEIFQQADAHEEPTNSFVLGVSRLDKAKLSDSNSSFNAMLTCLKELDAKAGKRPRVGNQERDILISETAIELNHTLVTNDKNLAKATRKFGGHSIKFKALRQCLAK